MTGIALLILGIFLIGSRKNFFGAKYTIYGTFHNVSGLQPGNNVRFNGINIGTVEKIEMVSDSSVTVTMNVQKRMQQYIKSNATAGISSDGLMGDRLIVITPGKGGGEVLADKSYLATTPSVDFDKSIAKLNKVIDNATEITSAVAGISGQIKSGKGTIGRLIYHDDLAQGLEKTISAAQKTVDEVHSTVSAAHSTVDDIHTTVNDIHEAVSTAHNAIDSAKSTIRSAQRGVEGFADNMDAVKNSFFFRGYFKRKQHAAKARHADSVRMATQDYVPENLREARRNRRTHRLIEQKTEVPNQITGIAAP